MKSLHNKSLIVTASIFVSMFSLPVQASFNWSFTSGCGNGSQVVSCSQNSNGNIATATAWSTKSSSPTAQLEQGTLGRWDGLGVTNTGEGTSSPNHATDNSGRYDSILFNFTTAVALTQVSMGWVQNDADFSLLRYIGDGSGSPDNLTNETYSGLTSGGSWELVGNYNSFSGGADNQTANVNGSGVNYNGSNINSDLTKTSSLWLVAAMNGNWGWTDSNKDYFKLKSLAGYTPPPPDIPGVPEPSTLALMSMSFLAFGFTQRRRKRNLALD